MSRRKALTLIVYAPALLGNDGRPLAIVHGMEHAFPGLRMDREVGDRGRLIALPQRDAWLVERTEGGGFPLLCNGDESYPVTVSGWENPALLSAGQQAQLEVHAKLPLDETALKVVAAVLEGVAEEARCFWGHASPYGYGSEVSQQLRRSAHGPDLSPRGLPVLDLPERIRSPEIPHFLGWINYWSAAAALSIGFPDPARDAELIARARQTASGGWVVQLTAEPLDYNNAEHLEVLKQTYERFPTIGGRAEP
jgi:hypothetical protein